ncbi:MAG: 1-(5-phosphoribosyl)-5-[(5-phosphoribosylamino)methylideneamino]imidazole-4-carboxamide isomerase [Pseudomonadota bacterium]
MIVIPAIDLKDGRCVRLRQGEFDQATVFSDDPLAMATHWVQQGAQRLHLVDLDGALSGEPKHLSIVRAIVQAFPEIPMQIGGGIRDLARIADYIDAGVRWVIIGTSAVTNPEFVESAAELFPNKIIVGIDAKKGFVATDGWSKVTDIRAIDLAQRFQHSGVSAIIYTDIARDGMMQGVNVEETSKLAQELAIPVIASGGVHALSDIQKLTDISNQLQAGPGIQGVIVGTALYEHSFTLPQAIEISSQNSLEAS